VIRGLLAVHIQK